MNIHRFAVIGSVGLALCLSFGVLQTPLAFGQAPAGKGGKGKGGGFAQDPRAKALTYHFTDTNEELPYSLYVSTKVSKDRPAPMIVTLHGLGAPQTIMMTKAAVDLAEEGGYILVAPMGYNTGGWWGSPVMVFGGGAGKGKGGPGAGKGGPGDAAKGGDPGAAKGGPGAGKGGGFGGAANPPNLAELSEKDVFNVIDLVKKEYKVDPSRMYLMGHSMGGAGTYFLGSKHANMWAAIAPIAPAAFLMNNNRAEILQKIKDAKLPMMVVQGDIDEAVPVTNTRMWMDTAKEIGLDYEYVEQPGITHGPVIETALKPIHEFFAKHKK